MQVVAGADKFDVTVASSGADRFDGQPQPAPWLARWKVGRGSCHIFLSCQATGLVEDTTGIATVPPYNTHDSTAPRTIFSVFFPTAREGASAEICGYVNIFTTSSLRPLFMVQAGSR